MQVKADGVLAHVAFCGDRRSVFMETANAALAEYMTRVYPGTEYRIEERQLHGGLALCAAQKDGN